VDFSPTEDQQSIRDAVLKHCARFPDDYWLERDHDGAFPRDFHRSMAESAGSAWPCPRRWAPVSAEAGFEACHTAMLTLGGMGYAQEYHVERYLREVLIPRTASVSPHMILNFLAEKVLDLPKSY
jgi:Acyl-CoA dehydrogenase, C-terminal domain